MESSAFKRDSNGDLELAANVSVKYLGSGTVKKYSEDLVFCSMCYRGLMKMCTLNSVSGTSYIVTVSTRQLVFKKFRFILLHDTLDIFYYLLFSGKIIGGFFISFMRFCL